MDSTVLWLVVLSISIPIVAVVCFIIQLRQVRTGNNRAQIPINPQALSIKKLLTHISIGLEP